ncbi:unnamed protein product [Pleuronectes platessa]|uniref:HMG box domain-containing protein n=1 Tax=Pleuronectes platessa TaxID=8262 RepID=A0A9N7U3E9_PLEPL|nr:unnamed protein product [Pleuronectes platessa]
MRGRGEDGADVRDGADERKLCCSNMRKIASVRLVSTAAVPLSDQRGAKQHDQHTQTTAASSIHPLIPLLLYSDTHFPPSSPYNQPIGSSGPRQADAHSRAHACYHSNGTTGHQAVKKPLNAFMLYMKEMRHKVLQEGRERESAAINRILGRRWNALSRSEQSKYYDLAQKERLLHMQLYPGWSARDNYGQRKRKQSQQRSGSFSGWTLTSGRVDM